MIILTQVLSFAATLIGVVILNRWITRRVQVVGLRLTGSEQAALLTYYVLLLPGILVHELSHVAMARLLGLKVGKLSLGPRRRERGKVIELGSVTVSRGGVLRDSLVGLAPFLSGTAVILLVGSLVFGVAEVGQAWSSAGWQGTLAQLGDLSEVKDAWLWAYLVFAVSNAMMPSPADRQPWATAAIYVALALILAYLLGGLPVLARALGDHVAGGLQFLTLAFLLTLTLDLAAAAVLLLVELVIVVVSERHA